MKARKVNNIKKEELKLLGVTARHGPKNKEGNLTHTGIKYLVNRAKKIFPKNVKLKAISSDVERAQETARLATNVKKENVIIEPELNFSRYITNGIKLKEYAKKHPEFSDFVRDWYKGKLPFMKDIKEFGKNVFENIVKHSINRSKNEFFVQISHASAIFALFAYLGVDIEKLFERSKEWKEKYKKINNEEYNPLEYPTEGILLYSSPNKDKYYLKFRGLWLDITKHYKEVSQKFKK